jgi:hypothetical protein
MREDRRAHTRESLHKGDHEGRDRESVMETRIERKREEDRDR